MTRALAVLLIACSAAPPKRSPEPPAEPMAPFVAPADAGPRDENCDAIVEKVLQMGGLGVTARSGLAEDPVCSWRIDEATAAATATKYTGTRPPWPTYEIIASGGAVDATKLLSALRKAARAVLACTAEPTPLRVRFTVDTKRAVSGVLLDFTRTFPPETATCVEHVLDRAKLPKPSGGPATLTFTFATKR